MGYHDVSETARTSNDLTKVPGHLCSCPLGVIFACEERRSKLYCPWGVSRKGTAKSIDRNPLIEIHLSPSMTIDHHLSPSITIYAIFPLGRYHGHQLVYLWLKCSKKNLTNHVFTCSTEVSLVSFFAAPHSQHNRCSRYAWPFWHWWITPYSSIVNALTCSGEWNHMTESSNSVLQRNALSLVSSHCTRWFLGVLIVGQIIIIVIPNIIPITIYQSVLSGTARMDISQGQLGLIQLVIPSKTQTCQWEIN